MREIQQVRVTNNDVGCGLIILMIGLLMGGCTMGNEICKRIEGLEKAIRNEPKTEQPK